MIFCGLCVIIYFGHWKYLKDDQGMVLFERIMD